MLWTIIQKIKPFFLRILERFPRLRRAVRRADTAIWLRKWRNSSKQNVSEIPFEGPIEISPSDIEDAIVRNYEKWNEIGRIEAGDWDRQTIPFTEIQVYEAIKGRIESDVEWSDTKFYQRVVNSIKKGEVKWGCTNEFEFQQRCDKIDDLINNIRTNGYQSQEEVATTKGPGLLDEVSVNIDRSGRILFEDGRHRLSIAKVLRIPQVPAIVTLRHKDWQDFRKDVWTYVHKHKTVYAPVPHPDLANVPSSYSHKRLALIMANLDCKNRTALDIGAHWGYFCHNLEDAGFQCVAAENSTTHLYFLNRLRIARSRQFQVFEDDILDYAPDREFGVVLALRIFHHFLKNKKDHDRLIQFLRRLKTESLFLNTHRTHEPQMRDAYRNYSLDEMIDFIREHSCLDKVEILESDDVDRPLVKLSL